MERMATLHEICVHYAKKQTGMADSLTEDAPILRVVKWRPATHGMWNVAEVLTEVEGPGWVRPDTPLPTMRASSDLVHIDLQVLGGSMEVPSDRARKFGGPEKYFANKQDAILRMAGMATEKNLALQNWLKCAREEKKLKNAGGTGKGWFILAVRFDEINNCGLYDPDQFDSGRLLKIEFPYGGEEHHLRGKGYEDVLGYEIAYRGHFGWQLLKNSRTCAAIVNIDEKNSPTPAMIDDALADVRAQPGSTYLFCSPKAKIYGINPHKVQNVQLVNADREIRTMVETWNGIPIVSSHNLTDKIAYIAV